MLNLTCNAESRVLIPSCCEGPYCSSHGLEAPSGQRIPLSPSALKEEENLKHLKSIKGSISLGPELLSWTSEGVLLLLSSEGDLMTPAFVPEGISALVISPDESILSIVTLDEKKLLLMNVYTWEDSPVSINLEEDCPGAHEGSKSDYDGPPSISWRSDGSYLAVSFNLSQQRWIHIYERSGACLACLEPQEGRIGPGVSWRPSGGSLIAFPRVLPSGKGSVITLMEKNGLPHGEISLEALGEGLSVTQMAWNASGSILALNIRLKDATNALILLMSSNYTWEIKFFRRYDDGFILWDESKPHVLRLRGPQLIQTFLFTLKASLSDFPFHTSSYPQDSLRNLAVIDGSILKMTPFGRLTIPPPSSAYELAFKDFVRCLTFGMDLTLSVLTEDGRLYVFHYGESPTSSSSDEVKFDGLSSKDLHPQFLQDMVYKSVRVYELKTTPLDILNLTWVSSGGRYLASSASGKKLLVFEDFVTLKEEMELPENVLNITFYPDMSIVQLLDGSCYSYSNGGGPLTPWSPCPVLPEPCHTLQVLGSNKILLGLSASNRFYANSLEIASDVNSFGLTKEFLLLATNRHVLKVYKVSNLQNPEASRPLERGSKILLCLESSLLLQMPRGNLEKISPRPLILHYVKSQLDSFHYAELFPTLRRHRLDLNLFVDHNPEAFSKRLRVFLRDMETNNLCLFVSELVNEDVTTTIFKDMYERSSLQSHRPKKIDALCTEILQALEDMKDLPGRHLIMICCHIKHSSRRISQALQIIDELRKSGEEESAEAGLSYISLLLHPNEIFQGALLTYDLDFVAYVASKATSKDPKEYVPFLNHLRTLNPPSLRFFAIHKHLGDVPGSLIHVASPDFPHDPSRVSEVLSLVKSTRLYAKALISLRHRPAFLIPLSEAYGDYLCSKKYFRDAALAYELGGISVKASRAWIASGDWRRGLSKGSGGDGGLLSSALESLKAERRFEDLGELYMVHCNHPEEAIAAYCEGGYWAKALEIIHRLNREDMLVTNLLPSLELRLSEYFSLTRESHKTLTMKVNRLETLLESKNKSSEEAEDEDGHDEDDAYSDASVRSLASSRRTARSVNTLLTRASSSSRDRRKLNKKLYSSKENSQFEDIAIVAELHGLISRVYAFLSEASETLSVLVEVGRISDGVAFQGEIKALLMDIKRSLSGIWIKQHEDVEEDHHQTAAATNSRPPYHLLEPHLQFPPREPPLISRWEIQLLNETLSM